MDKPWYRRMFSPSRAAGVETTQSLADGGNADAQFSLGLKATPTVPAAAQDYVQAAVWYAKAAAQNHALAQVNLGMMFAKGQGMPRDDDQAAAWFRKAADQGDASAQFQLGNRHHRLSLRGSAGNLAEARIEAYKWFHLAAEQGYKGADSVRSTMVAGMSHEDVTMARNRAAAYEADKAIHTQAE